MNARLLIIDPQNDFCDIPGAALPVAGAHADMRGWPLQQGAQLADITVTLDRRHRRHRTHHLLAQADGPVAPFTQIAASESCAGASPRDVTAAGCWPT